MASLLQGRDNKYASCMVDGDTVYFQAIVANGADRTWMRIDYSESLSGGELVSPAHSASVNGLQNEVLRVAIPNLPRGKKYYYRCVFNSSDSSWGVGLAPVNTHGGAAGDRYFVTQADGLKPFKFAIISDAHLNGYQTHGTDPTEYNSHKDTILENDLRDELNKFSQGVLANAPDFVIWLGDDIFNGSTEADRITAYRNFGVACSELGIPQYHVVGNHELENLDNFSECFNETTGKTHRETYLLHPKNHAQGQYGYTDYGMVRIIYLTPYAAVDLTDLVNKYGVEMSGGLFTLIGATAPEKLKFSQEQIDFLQVVTSEGSQVMNIICLHQFPFFGTNDKHGDTIPTDLLYDTFGGITKKDADYSYDADNAHIFNAIKNSGKQSIILTGHNHLYGREVQQDGIYAFCCPSPTCWRTDPEEGEAGRGGSYPQYSQESDLWYYSFGYYKEGGSINPNYNASDNALANLIVEINPISETIKTYAIKADATGDKVSDSYIPELEMPFNLRGSVTIG